MKICKNVLAAVMLMHSATFAQTKIVPAAAIEDSVLGWMSVYSVPGARKPVKVDDRVYSPAQLSIADSLATWIQASYVPKGGLGQVAAFVPSKLGLYNRDDAALPQA